MPRPTSGTTLQRPDLGALAFEYTMNAADQGFIGLEVMPVFTVPEQSMDYPKIPIESILKDFDTSRAPRGAYNRSDWEFETGTFSCREHGWEELLDDVERRLYARFFDAESIATQRATLQILRAHERRVAAKLFDTANAVGNTAVSIEWSTAATCTPKADVKLAKDALRNTSGIMANAVVMSEKVLQNLLVCAELKNYLQYTNPHLLQSREAQLGMLAQYFDVERVIVGGAQRDTAKKGKAFSLADIWDDEYVSVCKLGGQIAEPVFGLTFLWTADSPNILMTESYRDEAHRSDVYRVRQHTDEAIVFTGANYLLTNITI